MTLAVAVKSVHGIVLAVDRRNTYEEAGKAPSDDAVKVHSLQPPNDNISIALCGQIGIREIGYDAKALLSKFQASLGTEKLPVRQLAKKLSTLYRRELQKGVKGDYTWQDTQILVAGYDEDSANGKVFLARVSKQHSRLEEKIQGPRGVETVGQSQMADRLICGETFDLDGLGLEGCMTLALTLIEVTARIQELTTNERGVSKPANAAVITPSGRFDSEAVVALSKDRRYVAE